MVGVPLVDPTGVPSASVTEAEPCAEKVTSSVGFDAAANGPAATIATVAPTAAGRATANPAFQALPPARTALRPRRRSAVRIARERTPAHNGAQAGVRIRAPPERHDLAPCRFDVGPRIFLRYY